MLHHSSNASCFVAPARGRGFTLIEILVVVVIIGIMASMAVLSVNVLGRDSQVEDEARRFWTVLRQTREEAELQGLNIGAYFAAEQYEFLRLDPLTNRWMPIGDDRLYATHGLPEGLRYRMWLDDREIVMKPKLPDRKDDEEEKEKKEKKSGFDEDDEELPEALRTMIDRSEPPPPQENPPQLVAMSSGEMMPFELHFERERQPALWRITATADNNLRLEQRPTSSDDWEIVLQTNPPIDEREAKSNARK